MPVIVDTDSERARSLGSQLGIGDQPVTTPEKLENWLIRRPAEYAVLIGPELNITDSLRIAENLRLTRPSTSVIMIRNSYDSETLPQAMAAGIREVILSQDIAGIRSAIDRARQVYEAIHGADTANNKVGKVISVYSPKGGVGKTTTSVNLAAALANGGKNSVCIVDLDLAFGDVSISLQLVPQHTIADTIEPESHLDYSLLQTLITPHENGLYVLAAPIYPDAKDRISSGLVAKIIKILREQFDYIVVDTAPGFDEQVLQAFDDTDEIVLITTLDIPTIKNVKMSIDTLNVLELAVGRRWLVLNRAAEDVGITAENVERILGIPVAVSLNTSSAVGAATNSGTPLVISDPNHQFSQGIRQLANSVGGRGEQLQAPPVYQPKETEDPNKRGILGRIRKG